MDLAQPANAYSEESDSAVLKINAAAEKVKGATLDKVRGVRPDIQPDLPSNGLKVGEADLDPNGFPQQIRPLQLSGNLLS